MLLFVVQGSEKPLRRALDVLGGAVDDFGEPDGQTVEFRQAVRHVVVTRFVGDQVVEAAAGKRGNVFRQGLAGLHIVQARYTLLPNLAQWAVLAMSTGFSPRRFCAARYATAVCGVEQVVVLVKHLFDGAQTLGVVPRCRRQSACERPLNVSSSTRKQRCCFRSAIQPAIASGLRPVSSNSWRSRLELTRMSMEGEGVSTNGRSDTS